MGFRRRFTSSVTAAARTATAKQPAKQSAKVPTKQSSSNVAETVATTVLLTESPAKAKKIQQYLGPAYKVLASYGHLRDLAPRPGSVQPEAGFALTWERARGAAGRLAELRAALGGAKALVLATDPDREGEAISWHALQELQAGGTLRGVAVARITFSEVTREAVSAALAAPRDVSAPLVDAYLARRALDYLVGFHLSPLLWRKLPGAKSAGRVQSVALRLVCEREAAVEAFVPREYWTVSARLHCPGAAAFDARLVQVNGDRVGAEGLPDEASARAAAELVRSVHLQVAGKSDRTTSRNPTPPFVTSTLQQDASTRLGLSPPSTMQLAQQLYEGPDDGEGLITYIRTDGVQIGAAAVAALREAIKATFGPDYVPATPREYKTRAKNAQEAHEAIRPTRPGLAPPGTQLLPSSPLYRLYDLIWRRALASQMAPAALRQVGVDIAGSAPGESGSAVVLRASGSHVTFPGFLAAYPSASRARDGTALGAVDSETGSDEDSAREAKEGGKGEEAAVLAGLREGEALEAEAVTPTQHFTKPLGRYTEASLVKALEEAGVGRPSTYAAILKVLQDRGYVEKAGGALRPTARGRVLTAFLVAFFARYVDAGFTSNMEAQLDSVSGGGADWRAVLGEFWGPFQERVAAASGVGTKDIVDALDALLADAIFSRPVAARYLHTVQE